jgi:hypothetical protein
MVCSRLICSRNKSLQTLSLSNNQIGDVGAALIGGALAYVQSRLPTFSVLILYILAVFWARHPIFWFDKGLIKVCSDLKYSQNKTLQALILSSNQIGDAGAASIGGALAYVQTRHPTVYDSVYSFCVQLGHTIRLFGWTIYYIIKVFFRWFGSQCTSLVQLLLHDNQIGDAGASGIGAGIAYVVLLNERSLPRHAMPADFLGLIIGHYQGVFVFDWQSKHVSHGIGTISQQYR